MGSLKVSIIAVVATLTPLLAASSASDADPHQKTVECEAKDASATVSVPNSENEEASKTVTVSEPNSTVNFVCPENYTFDPAVTNGGENQKVYTNISCDKTEPLTTYCPKATLKAGVASKKEGKTPAATLEVLELPADQTAVFYVQCKPQEDQKTARGVNAGGQIASGQTGKAQAPCKVQVTVDQAPKKDETGGAGQAGEVHVCTHPSITVKVPDKDSSVQSSCEEQFTLYPTDIARVFKDDCKTEVPLKDMRRTIQAAAPAPGSGGARSPRGDEVAPTVYMLKAVKKPPKKKTVLLMCNARTY